MACFNFLYARNFSDDFLFYLLFHIKIPVKRQMGFGLLLFLIFYKAHHIQKFKRK